MALVCLLGSSEDNCHIDLGMAEGRKPVAVHKVLVAIALCVPYLCLSLTFAFFQRAASY